MRRVEGILLAFALSAATKAQAPHFDMLNYNVVRVETHRDHPEQEESADETGSGLILDTRDGVVRIVTAHHLVLHASKVKVAFFGDKLTLTDATVMPASSDSLDLAVLEARPAGTIRGTRAVPVISYAPSSQIVSSMHVWTVNGSWEPVPNNVVRLDHEGDTREFEYTATSLGEGYSGGPVFDDAGRLIGIHTAEIPKRDYHLGLGVKMGRVMETLQALGYDAEAMNAVAIPAETGTNNARTRTTDTTARVPSPSPTRAPGNASMGSLALKDDKLELWKCLNNNQVYGMRFDGEHIDVLMPNGTMVGNLTFRDKDKKYVGKSGLSTCPAPGYIEFSKVTTSRIDGKLEMKPAPVNGQQGNCGGIFGMGKTVIDITFVAAQR